MAPRTFPDSNDKEQTERVLHEINVALKASRKGTQRGAARTGMQSSKQAAEKTDTASIAVSGKLDEIERERKYLENRDYAQNTELKRQTLRRLFWFLGIETGVIFAFAFAQGTRLPFDFYLEDWSFRLLVTATIAQITGMLFVAVRYLFPKNGA